MTSMSVALPRRLLVFGLAVLVSLSSLLYGSSMARAEQMVASWYGPGFEGLTTANGEIFDPDAYTAAHRSLPFNTKLIVSYEGKSVVVRINDRGPYVAGRDLDLSQAAAEYIGLTRVGTATVQVDYADASTPTGPYDAGASRKAPAPGQQPEEREKAAPDTPQQQAPQNNNSSAAKDQYAHGTSGTNKTKGEAPGRTAAEDQYGLKSDTAAKDQYEPKTDTAAENQYAQPSSPRNGMGSSVPVPPSPPDPGSLEAPPSELVKPGSTVEKRIILVYAAPPAGFEKLPEQTASTASAEQNSQSGAVDADVASAPAGHQKSGESPVRLVSGPAKEPGSSEGASEESGEVSPGATGGELVVLPDTGGVPSNLLLWGGLLFGGGLLLRRLVR